MRKIIAAIVALAVLAGCGAQPVGQTEYDKKIDELYRAIIKYEVMYGTPEEQKNMKPISDEEVHKLAEYLQGLKDDEGVTDNVYGETAGR